MVAASGPRERRTMLDPGSDPGGSALTLLVTRTVSDLAGV